MSNHIALENGSGNWLWEDGNVITWDGGASWYAALDTGITVNVTSGDVSLRLRIGIEETAGATGPSAYKIRYSKNSGAYTDLTAASTEVQTFDTTYYADADDVPQIITSGTYQADNNAAEESTGAFTLTAGLAASTKFECETTLKLIRAALADADTLDFRVTQSDGTVLDVYTNTPRITIVKSAPVPYNPFPWQNFGQMSTLIAQ